MVGVAFGGGIDESCDVECVEELVEVCENEQCHEEIFSSIVWVDSFPIILKEFIIVVPDHFAKFRQLWVVVGSLKMFDVLVRVFYHKTIRSR